MKSKIYFLAIILISLLASCSSSNKNRSAKQEEVVFDDGYKTSANNEVVINDSSSESAENAASGKGLQKTTRTAIDGSQIVTTFDALGNKTETRTFPNNSLLKSITLNTAVGGSKKGSVYAQNGEVKDLPENMLNKLLTASPNELANSVGIYESYKEPTITQNNQPPSVTTLKPLPSSQFPIKNQQVERTPTPEKVEEKVEEDEKPQTAENKKDSEPPPKSEDRNNLNKK